MIDTKALSVLIYNSVSITLSITEEALFVKTTLSRCGMSALVRNSAVSRGAARAWSTTSSSDGQAIVSASADSAARVWPGIEQLLALTKTLVDRELPAFTLEAG